ncbi:TetR/AcrR family transcriptional regulator [Streptomyces sp. MP131-18]|uniref:TetR/AcrR family transcriptional regulator n=1 Tax=Streptomyces sp. MP131-18 TaxID=1857892 RepID=UPI00097C5D2B|nr:TetR/AcrR family transcriptional regulator [Streptomyces sp. MP131-18]ONK14168.1 transcriptional regulator BetI [Streptomyces sp. MP131-18]
MPRPVDKDARRQDVAAALFRIAAREGLGAVSMRTVAAEAGFSLGAVQRYFRSKDEMLRFALDLAVSANRERLAGIAAGSGRPAFPEALRQALLTFLPTDAQRLAEARIWIAFFAEAAVRPDFAEVVGELDTEARTRLRRVLTAAAEAGEVDQDLDPDAVAELVLVLIDGLLSAAARHRPGASLDPQRAAIDAAVAALTRGPGREA